MQCVGLRTGFVSDRAAQDAKPGHAGGFGGDQSAVGGQQEGGDQHRVFARAGGGQVEQIGNHSFICANAETLERVATKRASPLARQKAQKGVKCRSSGLSLRGPECVDQRLCNRRLMPAAPIAKEHNRKRLPSGNAAQVGHGGRTGIWVGTIVGLRGRPECVDRHVGTHFVRINLPARVKRRT